MCSKISAVFTWLSFDVASMHVHCMLYFYYRAVKLMLLHNPESVKVTNDYLYNIIHIATLNDHRDIIPVAIEVSKTLFYAEKPF